jgi:hypothetical protein
MILIERLKPIPKDPRASRYPLALMKVGDSFWEQAPDFRGRNRVRSALVRWKESHPGWQFTTRAEPKSPNAPTMGIRVWRTK